ncbi:MAG TPA: MFS transporter [Longimicrobiaceae bacterium]|nr:MFS transporter [Longimicrobiaceae bacterium]
MISFYYIAMCGFASGLSARGDRRDHDRRSFGGMESFSFLWLGQVALMLGAGMMQFTLALWAWERTGSVLPLTLMGVSTYGPALLISPFAGVLVDRWSRRGVLLVSDALAGVLAGCVLLLHAEGVLEMWHIYVVGGITGVLQAFHFPALSAAITMMVDREHYARASGMLSLGSSASVIAAPMIAGLLTSRAGLPTLFTLQALGACFAVATLLLVRIPEPARRVRDGPRGRSVREDSLFGFRYIFHHPSLRELQLLFLSLNVLSSLALAALSPMVLARTEDDAAALGSVLSAGGIGGVTGGLLMSVWGGPRRRIHGVLGGMVLCNLLGACLIGLGRQPAVWALGMFAHSLLIPVVNGSGESIWQTKVPASLQGRVFAIRRLITQAGIPLAMFASGVLADEVFEPALKPGRELAGLFGGVVGTERGSGLSLMILLAGSLGAVLAAAGYSLRSVREIDALLPDVGGKRTAPGGTPGPSPRSLHQVEVSGGLASWTTPKDPAPGPGTAIFLDRDGVVIENRDDYVKSPSEVRFLPGAAQAVQRLGRLDARIILISNQSMVGRGIVSQEDALAIHGQVIAHLLAEGGRVDASYVCLHHPRDGCVCRKPAPGMLREAARRYGLDLARCYLVGDAASDLQAACAVGTRGILVRTGRGAGESGALATAGLDGACPVVSDLSEAAELILAWETPPPSPGAPTPSPSDPPPTERTR